MIIITLTKVPYSLRGDLTKWYQEIQSGVYVGNVSARVRDELWSRIIRDIGNGQATMVYTTNNELGYTFKTSRPDYQVIDYDGIPLMMHLNTDGHKVNHGFSNAAKFHKARLMTNMSSRSIRGKRTYKNHGQLAMVAIDIETTGLDISKDKIISLGAAKYLNGEYTNFYQLIKITDAVPENITKLTGITSAMLESEGIILSDAFDKLKKFIGNLTVVGYNSHFDEAFIYANSEKLKTTVLSSKILDLMPIIKKKDTFIDNYRLVTVLNEYGIKNEYPHHALFDAKATLELANKLVEKQSLQI